MRIALSAAAILGISALLQAQNAADTVSYTILMAGHPAGYRERMARPERQLERPL